ncbi:hypothetical protein ACOME3_008030 [Neoechinorhynchus agilis]
MELMKLACTVRALGAWMFNPKFNLSDTITKAIDDILPPNAHELCSGRLFVAMTKWREKESHIVSRFNTREELIEYHWDGGMSDFCPILNDSTVRVCPFISSAEISPIDESTDSGKENSWLDQLSIEDVVLKCGFKFKFCSFNAMKIIPVFLPKSASSFCELYESGYSAALRFIQKRELFNLEEVEAMTKMKSTINRIQSISMLLDDDIYKDKQWTTKDYAAIAFKALGLPVFILWQLGPFSKSMSLNGEKMERISRDHEDQCKKCRSLTRYNKNATIYNKETNGKSLDNTIYH